MDPRAASTWRCVVACVLALTAMVVETGQWAGAIAGPTTAAFLGKNAETSLLEPDGRTRVLTAYPTNAGTGGGLALDPAGTTVATTRPQGFPSEIVIVSIADGDLRAVPSTLERNCKRPAFHPDGAHLFAVCSRATSAAETVDSLDIFHRERGFVRTIIERPSRPGTFDADNPFFIRAEPIVSPTGETVVLHQALADGAHQLWRVDVGSGQVQRFNVAGAEEYSATAGAFLPDGRVLGTKCTECVGAGPGPASPRTDIVVFTLSGQVERVLHTVEGLAFAPALSPDQQTLLFSTSAPPTFEVVLWAMSTRTQELRQVGDGIGATYPQAVAGQPPAAAAVSPAAAPPRRF